MSPSALILIRSTPSVFVLDPAGAVKNCNSLLVDAADDSANILVFCATLITPPREPHALPGPYPSN